MESAFVNIGLEKNAFLYVNDLREFEEKYLDGICNSERPIEDILTVGDEVVVQVLSEPRGTKGARVTTHYTIPGKYLVLMPNNNHIAISKKIKEEEERNRLEEIVRDLKPENIIIKTDGNPVILDLGIAKKLYSSNSITLTNERMPLSNNYCAPEQYKNEDFLISIRTDFFVLGIVLSEIYTGIHLLKQPMEKLIF